MALCVAFAAGAQTGLAEFPYNPDADNDDLIGVNDLMALLSLFGAEFTEEGLFVADGAAFYLIPSETNMTYGPCISECGKLAGQWWVPRMEDLKYFNDSVVEPWGMEASNDKFFLSHRSHWPSMSEAIVPSYAPSINTVDAGGTANDIEHCVCFTKEKRKVEYTYVQGSINGGDPTYFQTLATAKTEDGWYPLGGIQFYGQENQCAQSFWRWAE